MQPNYDPAVLAQLLERCQRICQDSRSQVDQLGAEKGSFLTFSLGDSLQQLELVLRLLKEERSDSPKRIERQSLLKRLFTKPNESETPPDNAAGNLPEFDVSHQGLHGNAATVPLSELMSFLAFSKKTGVLWVDSPNEDFLIGMVKGNLMHATSDHTPEGLRLGEVLVGLGFLTRRQLERFLEKTSRSMETISGELLLESGMISPEELSSALVYQVQRLFQRLVATNHALFRFREGMEVTLAYKVQLDINQLLLQSARAQDEEAYAQERATAKATDWRWLEQDVGSTLGSIQTENLSVANTPDPAPNQNLPPFEPKRHFHDDRDIDEEVAA